MMLKDKVAVIYGAGGAVGGAVARAFAAEGAEPLPITTYTRSYFLTARLAARCQGFMTRPIRPGHWGDEDAAIASAEPSGLATAYSCGR
jgi:shikimate 5-dehydrogenase